MRKIGHVLLIVLATTTALAAVALAYARTTGLTARSQPGSLEVWFARVVRSFAIPRGVREQPNPVPLSPEVLAEGLAHFADHCSVCHANDGGGKTEMGQGMWPKPPDMRLAATQELTDGELFYVIEQGIRFTGMPAWGTGTPEGEQASWHLVHFIRHLPQITNSEVEAMEAMNPRSPVEVRQEIEAERFLQGDDVAPVEPAAPAHAH